MYDNVLPIPHSVVEEQSGGLCDLKEMTVFLCILERHYRHDRY